MLDLTPRPHAPVSVEGTFTLRFLSVRVGALRKGVEAMPAALLPQRVGRDEDRLRQLDRLVRKRLDLVRGGLREVCRQARSGRGDEAVVLVEKLEEDLAMLQSRVRREVESPPAVPRS